MTQREENEQSIYRAPALSKGLDILEVLATSEIPQTMNDISRRLNRTKNEIIRMIRVLEARHYIEQVSGAEGFVITNKLFLMGAEHPRSKGLIDIASPLIHQMACDISQSVHIAVQSVDQIVVVARAEAPDTVNFSVRIGYRQAIAKTTSGAVMFAFQPRSVQAEWLKLMHQHKSIDDENDFLKRADRIHKRGYEKADSAFVKGVIDLSAPVLENDHAVAALTVPYVEKHSVESNIRETIDALRATADQISHDLRFR